MTFIIKTKNSPFRLHLGSCLDVLKSLEENSVDSAISDPPYALSFMKLKFDTFESSEQFREFSKTWSKQVFRVLKPGGYLVSFCGTRTYHNMAVGVEESGFICKDMMVWLYGVGFPKGNNISKAVLKQTSNKDLADYWKGYNTQLKPAIEPIAIFQKPLTEPTITKNVLKWGTGALNIDDCRIKTKDDMSRLKKIGKSSTLFYVNKRNEYTDKKMLFNNSVNGRYPANVLIEDDPELHQMFPYSKSGIPGIRRKESNTLNGMMNGMHKVCEQGLGYPGEGYASRFFYCAKVSRSERGNYNDHPTPKPLALMRYLVRLYTPHDGVVLDPFMGSGTTGAAALLEGKKFIGIEMDKHYFQISNKRIVDTYVKQRSL